MITDYCLMQIEGRQCLVENADGLLLCLGIW